MPNGGIQQVTRRVLLQVAVVGAVVWGHALVPSAAPQTKWIGSFVGGAHVPPRGRRRLGYLRGPEGDDVGAVSDHAGVARRAHEALGPTHLIDRVPRALIDRRPKFGTAIDAAFDAPRDTLRPVPTRNRRPLCVCDRGYGLHPARPAGIPTE